MNKKIGHKYIKRIIADRLRSISGPTGMVVTEVNVREGSKTLARADVVMYRNVPGPEVTIIEVKVCANQVIRRKDKKGIDARILRKVKVYNEYAIDSKILELMKVYGEYANEVYLCLPKKECYGVVCSLCKKENIGLIAVNIDVDDGPIGILDRRVHSTHRPVPKRWIDLYLRLEKLGMPPLFLV